MNLRKSFGSSEEPVAEWEAAAAKQSNVKLHR